MGCSSSEETMRELTEKREAFGGGDGRAINKHSVRVYEHDGRLYTLDRTLDGCPPFFTLFRRPASGEGMSETIRVNGAEHWGSGLSWPKAEAVAVEAVLELTGMLKPRRTR
jgi:hypothetical protein